ncbi:hypothetical protein F4810DRAFT_470116 [Camillea tinctor]|nr:hypothetical protein F4810DRAFT_470116 [Camillea tinctor]
MRGRRKKRERERERKKEREERHERHFPQSHTYIHIHTYTHTQLVTRFVFFFSPSPNLGPRTSNLGTWVLPLLEVFWSQNCSSYVLPPSMITVPTTVLFFCLVCCSALPPPILCVPPSLSLLKAHPSITTDYIHGLFRPILLAPYSYVLSILVVEKRRKNKEEQILFRRLKKS